VNPPPPSTLLELLASLEPIGEQLEPIEDLPAEDVTVFDGWQDSEPTQPH
jgi:hypothetical protein